MKRVIIYTVLFCVSFILMCLTITSLGWLFWLSFVLFAISCLMMVRERKKHEEELDDWMGKDDVMI